MDGGESSDLVPPEKAGWPIFKRLSRQFSGQKTADILYFLTRKGPSVLLLLHGIESTDKIKNTNYDTVSLARSDHLRYLYFTRVQIPLSLRKSPLTPK